ncbi:MAG: hypothetical protein JNL95_08140 [Chitinophagales bacterium]|nr:hypothetical protein [Chitinophagales bacterium]
MNKKIHILTYLLLPIFTSCTEQIDGAKYLDKNKNLKLTYRHDHNDLDKEEIITINSAKYKRLIYWLEKNQDNWTSSPASYVVDIGLTQDIFRLLYNHNFVVIGYKDENGQEQQYTRDTKDGELDFLINDN